MMRRYFYIIVFALSLSYTFPQRPAADPFFPSSGTDAQSLGRGGTVIATPPGKSSALGNPATLIPEGFFGIGAEYLRTRGTDEGSWVASIVDTSSSIRGALNYYSNPEFAGFEKNLWGVSLAQTLTPYLTLGESFHMGEYAPETGNNKDLSAGDLGVLLKLGGHVSLGYVARNLYRSESDLLERTMGFGAAISLPWTILVAVDYEEAPFSDGEEDRRAGIEFSPSSRFSGRLGYQDLVGGTIYYTAGLTYSDANGTIDAAVLYNKDTKRTDRIILGFTMGM
jgi:hypothetical protein